MFFTDLIVKLNYKTANKEAVLDALGQPLANFPETDDNKLIYIVKTNNDLQVVNAEKAKNLSEANKKKNEDEITEQLFAIERQKYALLTEGLNPLLNPEITDRLGIKIASAFASNMAKVLALFITAALLPLINLLAMPLVFSGVYFLLHLIRYRATMGRWPNKRELEHLLGYSLAAAGEMILATGIFMLLSSASILAPISVHILSIVGLPFGGPLFTYLIMPLIMATVIATATTIYNLARVLVNHFFDVRFHFSRKFPFFFTISLKQERESLATLAKNLVITAFREFTTGFIVSLIAMYLSYIPGALLGSYLSGPAISAASTALFTTSIQIVGSILDSVIISLALDKLFDTVFKPALSRTIDQYTSPSDVSPKQKDGTSKSHSASNKFQPSASNNLAAATTIASTIQERTKSKDLSDSSNTIQTQATPLPKTADTSPTPAAQSPKTEKRDEKTPHKHHSLFHHHEMTPAKQPEMTKDNMPPSTVEEKHNYDDDVGNENLENQQTQKK
ncbi:hypothetical protein [Legionella sp. W05-934-2]|uniref:hypothetical protein n=1 Tax=Legionella sp. W05-934-2 TaxID=1198649 RepID=UPI003463148B